MQTRSTDRQAAAAGEAATPLPRRRRDAVFSLLLLLALIAVLPGLALRLHLAASLPPPFSAWIAALDQAQTDIKFGSGLRFWLGVGGAGLMVLPLLYPLRKLGGFARRVGVGAWFNLHIVTGLLGPLLILYHCNFGLGSKPANVALATMLTVVASGIVGHFVFARVSGRYYLLKARADERLGDVMAALQAIPPGPPRDRFIDELQRFAAGEVTARGGPAAPPSEAELRDRALWLAATHPATPGSRGGTDTPQRLATYFAAVSKASRWQRREQLWRGWRLMHLPVFAIMVVATAIHVSRVWDFGPPAGGTPQIEEAPAALPTSPPSDRTASVLPGAGAPMATRTIRTLPMPSEVSPDANRRQPVAPTTVVPPRPIPAQRPAASAPVVPSPPPIATAPPPAKVAPIRPAMQPPPNLKPAPKTDAGETAIVELARRDSATTSGTFESAALAEKLRQLKADRFDHGKTRFPLTGLHVPLKCESCHKSTLKDTARECVACHKKDDVHRGRRNDCAQCHVTDDWTRIVRRR